MTAETRTVAEWQALGVLHVEDGNHGENRPRPSEFADEGMAFIRAADMRDGHVLFDQASKIDRTAEARVRKGIGHSSDILISYKGTIGRVARAPHGSPRFVCSPQTTFWRVTDGSRLDTDFLYAMLRSPDFQQTFSVRAGETDMAGYVSLTSQRALEITLPTLDEQREIGRVIGALDDKIELNRRMGATLEGMARALYRSWFVDFDPVHAKMRGEAPAHMDPATTALVPDRFGEDGLPEGWEQRSLDDIADFLNGAALQKFPPENEADSLSSRSRSFGLASPQSQVAQGFRSRKKYKISDGDVLFSWSGSLLQKVWTEGPSALNQHLFKVSSEVVPKWFHFFAVDQHMEEFRQVAASKATTMGHIQRHHLREAMIAMPQDDAIIAAAGRLIGPAFDRAIAADVESQTLAALRDTLLSRLISAELRIRDAEEQIEEVL